MIIVQSGRDVCWKIPVHGFNIGNIRYIFFSIHEQIIFLQWTIFFWLKISLMMWENCFDYIFSSLCYILSNGNEASKFDTSHMIFILNSNWICKLYLNCRLLTMNFESSLTLTLFSNFINKLSSYTTNLIAFLIFHLQFTFNIYSWDFQMRQNVITHIIYFIPSSVYSL